MDKAKETLFEMENDVCEINRKLAFVTSAFESRNFELDEYSASGLVSILNEVYYASGRVREKYFKLFEQMREASA